MVDPAGRVQLARAATVWSRADPDTVNNLVWERSAQRCLFTRRFATGSSLPLKRMCIIAHAYDVFRPGVGLDRLPNEAVVVASMLFCMAVHIVPGLSTEFCDRLEFAFRTRFNAEFGCKVCNDVTSRLITRMGQQL